MHPELLVIGLGNTMRGDDAAGVYAVQTLKAWGESNSESNTIRYVTLNDPSDLPLLWDKKTNVIVIDALKGATGAGQLVRIDVLRDVIPEALTGTSTHHFGLTEAIELSKTLKTLPEKLEIIGIAGENFQLGGKLSPRVRQGIDSLVLQLQSEFSEF